MPERRRPCLLKGEAEMTSEVEIRRATLNDWPTVAEFNCRLAAESEHKQLDRPTVELGVRAILQDEHKGRYFVACVNGAIVGQLMLTMEWSDWRNGDFWWLQSVYVLPEFRRQGIFRKLFGHVRKLAASTPQVVGLRLYVERDNARAQSTYSDLGMSSAGYLVMEVMRKDLASAKPI